MMEDKFYEYLAGEIGDDYSGTRLRRLAEDLADIVEKEMEAKGSLTEIFVENDRLVRNFDKAINILKKNKEEE